MGPGKFLEDLFSVEKEASLTRHTDYSSQGLIVVKKDNIMKHVDFV